MKFLKFAQAAVVMTMANKPGRSNRAKREKGFPEKKNTKWGVCVGVVLVQPQKKRAIERALKKKSSTQIIVMFFARIACL